jgi:hypothetical protein
MSLNSKDSPEDSSSISQAKEETATLHTIGKIADVASKNEAVALILAIAIGTSIVIYVAAKAAVLLLSAWHLVNCCLG